MGMKWYKFALLLFIFVLGSVLMSPSGRLLPVAQAQGSTVVNSATGSAHISLVGDGETYWDYWAFNAKLHSDGRVSGQIQFKDREAGYSFHGEIIDLKVDGNMAKIMWRFKREPSPGWPDGFVYGVAVVVDGGEGKKATNPDMVSWGIFLTGTGTPEGYGLPDTPLQEFLDFTPQEYVDWLSSVGFLTPELFAYVNGNIQVR